MKLDFNKVFTYPDIKFKVYDVDKFDQTMDDIYRYFKHDGDEIINLLNCFLSNKAKQEMINAIKNTEVSKDEQERLIKEDELF